MTGFKPPNMIFIIIKGRGFLTHKAVAAAITLRSFRRSIIYSILNQISKVYEANAGSLNTKAILKDTWCM